jgi:hypothetical protein
MTAPTLRGGALAAPAGGAAGVRGPPNPEGGARPCRSRRPVAKGLMIGGGPLPYSLLR